MSNLKLPTMTFSALMTRFNLTYKPCKIAYATTAEYANEHIVIRQHGNRIAVITRDIIVIDKCGYDSSTTANRLRKVLNDNGIDYYVRIRDFSMRLYNGSHTEIESDFNNATFTKHGETWGLQYNA